MAKLTGPAPAAPATVLDIAPLAAPVSPFVWMAKQLEAGDYAEGPELDTARQAHAWITRCAQEIPGLTSAEPIALAALARCATDARFRALLRTGIAALDALVARATAPPS